MKGSWTRIVVLQRDFGRMILREEVSVAAQEVVVVSA